MRDHDAPRFAPQSRLSALKPPPEALNAGDDREKSTNSGHFRASFFGTVQKYIVYMRTIPHFDG
jgi:hypothetical protein